MEGGRVQFDVVWEDQPANCTKALQSLEKAAPESGALFLLPQMFATGFSMNVAPTRGADLRETETPLARTAR